MQHRGYKVLGGFFYICRQISQNVLDKLFNIWSIQKITGVNQGRS